MSSNKSLIDEIVDAAVMAFESTLERLGRKGPSKYFNEDIEVGRPHLNLSKARSIEIVIDPNS